MSEYTASNDYRNYLMHYGVLGMKWGVRRYQNADGTLTAAGKKRQERYERNQYDYKKGDAYKNASRSEKSKMTEFYNSNRIIRGKKGANKAIYDIYEKKKYTEKEWKRRKSLQIALTSAGVYASRAAIDFGMSKMRTNAYYGSRAAQIAGSAHGLNTVKGGFSPTAFFKAANMGQKWTEYLRGKGSRPEFYF